MLELGLAAEDGQGDLRQMNFAALNSFHDPNAALRALFPGLKELRRHSVTLLTPASLLNRIGAQGTVIDLVLDSPGSEMQVLLAWKAAGALKHIRKLVVRCGSEPFFDGASGCADIDAWLSAEGFVQTAKDLTDPDWPLTHWQADPALRALKDTLSDAQSALSAKASALAEAEVQTRAAREAAQAIETQLIEISEKSEWRSKRIKELEAQYAQAAEATAAKLADADSRAQAAEDRAQTLEATLADLRAATDLQKKHLAEVSETTERRQKRIEELEADLATAKSDADGETKARADAEAIAKAAEDRAQTLEATLADLRTATDQQKIHLAEVSEKSEWRYKRIQELEAATKQSDQAGEALRKDAVEQKALHQEQQHRLTTARNDLRRAEGQIELIKDLLLRGETL